MKKGQVTLIIIIAIVLVGVLLVFFAFKEKIIFDGVGFDPEIELIYNQLSNCIEQRAIDAIRLVGLQGGYVVFPENFIDLEPFGVGYGFYNGRNVLLKESEIQKGIEKYIDSTVSYCVDEGDFLDYEVVFEGIKSKVRLSNKKINVVVEYPSFVAKGEKTFELNRDYKYEINIKLEDILRVANEIIEIVQKNSDSIDITYLSSLDYETKAINVDKNTMIYVITDDSESNPGGLPYSFRFGVEG